MKKSILFFAIAGLTAGTFATGKTTGHAYGMKRNATSEVTSVTQRDTLDEDYRETKRKWEAKIKKNEMRIAELRQKVNKDKSKMNAKLNQELIDMEATNSRLKRKINEYKRDTKEGWESFKREFNHDMDALGESLKNFVTDDKN